MTPVELTPLDQLPFWVHLFRVLVVFLIFLLTTALLIWAERRVVALMQSRRGPNRVGPLGIGQTLVDGLKMFFKEDPTPSMVDRAIYTTAPLVAGVVTFMTIAVIPFGGTITLASNTFRLQAADFEYGVLWLLAMGSLHVYAVFLAGWASQSPYPLMGGIRSTAQMISYEIAQGLAVASVIIYAGSLRISDIVSIQANEPGLVEGFPNWFAIPLVPAFVVYMIGMVAEAERPPFDLPEAEGELVAGYMTEYSGMRFGMFMLTEFMGVVIQSAIVITLFFGGPAGPDFGLPSAIAWIMPIFWFGLKTAVFVFFFILLRASQPRMRYDKLMDLGWKVLIPVALVWTLITAGLVLVNEQDTDLRPVIIGVAGVAILVLLLVPTGRVIDTDGDGPVRSTAKPVPALGPNAVAARDDHARVAAAGRREDLAFASARSQTPDHPDIEQDSVAETLVPGSDDDARGA